MSPTRSIIQSAPPLSGSSRHRASGEREQRRGKRDREKEGWSDRKRGEWEHISRPFSVTFVLSVWRATMNINMNPWRGNSLFFFFSFFFFFSLGYSCTQEIYSSQCNGQSLSLCMVVWTVQPRLYIFSLSLSLSLSRPPLVSVAGLVSVENTLCQVQLWRTLQYVNQIGLNACMSGARRHQSATATNQPTVFSQYNFWCFSHSLSSRSSSSSSSSSGA